MITAARHHFPPAVAAMLLPCILVFGACAPERDTGNEYALEEGEMFEPPPAADPDFGMPPPDAVTGEGHVEVTLVDGEIQMPITLAAGSTMFHVRNAGTQEHSIEIEGEGIEAALEAHLQPGQTGMLTLDLRPGTYRVYCPVSDHAERGMELQLEVTEAAEAEPAP